MERKTEGQAATEFKVGDLVQTMFDQGARMGAAVLYGEVIAAGPKAYRVRWESGITNRLPQGYFDVTRARDESQAREALAALAARGVRAALTEAR